MIQYFRPQSVHPKLGPSLLHWATDSSSPTSPPRSCRRCCRRRRSATAGASAVAGRWSCPGQSSRRNSRRGHRPRSCRAWQQRQSGIMFVSSHYVIYKKKCAIERMVVRDWLSNVWLVLWTFCLGFMFHQRTLRYFRKFNDFFSRKVAKKTP